MGTSETLPNDIYNAFVDAGFDPSDEVERWYKDGPRTWVLVTEGSADGLTSDDDFRRILGQTYEIHSDGAYEIRLTKLA